MSIKVSDFKAIRLTLASPENILAWSHGEVLKPETINYRTQKPEKDGLFCERIFGPEKDWECYCGKYRRIRYKGIICDKCGVEVTRSIVRRERMGHIRLAAPVSHIWFLRGVPSRIGLVLDLSIQQLEKVIYFAGYIVTKVDEEARAVAIEEIEKEYKQKIKTAGTPGEKERIKESRDKGISDLKNLAKLQILSEIDYFDLNLKYGHVFEAGIGAESVRKILAEIDLVKESQTLKEEIKKSADLTRKKLMKRLRLIEGLIKSGLRPEWMIVTALPVLPPDLRPMVALDGGRYATSDLNDLYRRVINRNNRLKRLLELNAPEVVCRNEKRMLQEAVDALIDNSARRGQGPVMAATGQKRQLKSLADILKGKQGRFRQNLLGKRVDYSGRSVIVVGPELKLYQCGLPKHMALEFFKPFVIQKLVEREMAHNIKGAGRLIEQETTEAWAILEEVIADKCVLLNRAPTLHRLGIQAFKPILIEGSAIQLHPIVCRAFNADFDGDQMAVHLPLTKEAQEEAEKIMLSSNNLLKPATGEPIAFPSQDMILGCYWMSQFKEGKKGEGKIFKNLDEIIQYYQFGEIDLRAKIKVYASSLNLAGNRENPKELIETSAGRIIFNQILPHEIHFINNELGKKTLLSLIGEIVEKCGIKKTAQILDRIKEIGFEYATKSGISWGMDDLKMPSKKKELLELAERDVETVHRQYLDGLLTREERRARIIEIWFDVIDKISKMVVDELDPDGSVKAMVVSGARGSWGQISQMMGIKGLVTNPSGEIIELPIKSSFKEGFNVLEFFIATHGARKGTADTALRTSTAGYLTRRLVDVAQDVVIREVDCNAKDGIFIYREDGAETGRTLGARVMGRVSLEDVKAGEKVLVKKGVLIDKQAAKRIDEAGLNKIKVRSVITCQCRQGVCQMCYGYDLGNNQLVKIGEAVGIVTAQAIGEPGTQLTMRTFHTGGVAGGGDITQGLPRVDEIFEARPPKGKAVISEQDGHVVEIEDKENQRTIQITGKIKTFDSKKKAIFKNEVKTYPVPINQGLWVKAGDVVQRGQQLSEGHLDLKELFKLAGKEAVQRYILREVQTIYASQGEGINDKHIEIIVKQMLSRVRVKDPGDTNLLAGDIIEKGTFLMENDAVRKKSGKIATAVQLLMGISKVSLTTDSWLSAASFQETARVLIGASIAGKTDHLRGLKENVIIGKLIPAGTGWHAEGRGQESAEQEKDEKKEAVKIEK
ncbi:MAG: DNA-directed RNA polymerase subunit beta' [Candidatus Portnoybacteria bacterium]|nr:DNA-directed RNA polymerase subunit beta' [Candidatus Portnoybacteria bacterium]